ncbi:accessory secretory protein Asp2 [Lactobacillus colini]|uniref:Accessory secretory protein Asp2 n=1 Tax=Lactobacillus colini TaxID=1819254 RepID=A0ABS4MH19_9LACO|nr:accessory Sec system protein Asp2 [Lactobacillus colini]MBP2058873.1 accessory secretory protein Asp2 [Lactobacillus colini]
MKILQLGKENWKDKYQIPVGIDWHYNDFPDNVTNNEKDSLYAGVIISEKIELSSENWKKLQWLVNPRCVLYNDSIYDQLSKDAQIFLKYQLAEKITEDPQILINHLLVRYYTKQSGIRILPADLALNEEIASEFEYADSGHMRLEIDTQGDWANLGSYRNVLYVDPNKLLDLWLEFKANDIQLRLKIFINYNSEIHEYTLPLHSIKETTFDLPISSKERFGCITVEAKGKGKLEYGILHARWSRDNKGILLVGGKRIVNPQNREEIVYYFNPGDLKPPLNIYFAGANELERFEAYETFRNFHSPSLLFADMRLTIGEFYDDYDGFMGQQIIAKITETLDNLSFGRSQLIINGISMGSYAALKYGPLLKPYMINVSKPITNLGLIALRTRLHRPKIFDTIFDIDYQINHDISKNGLEQMDKAFWDKFNNYDLSETRLFVSYMKNDDYDNKTITNLKSSIAIKKARQVTYKGFMGRHNDDYDVIGWFLSRLGQVIREDFNREI